MNARISSQPRTTKPRTAFHSERNGAQRELNIDVLIRTSDLAECAFYLIDQSAAILEANAEILEDTAFFLSQGSTSREAAAARMIDQADVLRLNASRMRQRAAPFRNGNFVSR